MMSKWPKVQSQEQQTVLGSVHLLDLNCSTICPWAHALALTECSGVHTGGCTQVWSCCVSREKPRSLWVANSVPGAQPHNFPIAQHRHFLTCCLRPAASSAFPLSQSSRDASPVITLFCSGGKNLGLIHPAITKQVSQRVTKEAASIMERGEREVQ